MIILICKFLNLLQTALHFKKKKKHIDKLEYWSIEMFKRRIKGWFSISLGIKSLFSTKAKTSLIAQIQFNSILSCFCPMVSILFKLFSADASIRIAFQHFQEINVNRKFVVQRFIDVVLFYWKSISFSKIRTILTLSTNEDLILYA